MGAHVADTRFADVRHFEELDSTNRYLLEEARGDAPEGVVAVADFQTAGRGRLGRVWMAPPGASLLVSVLLRPDVDPEAIHLVTMAGGIAACEAVFLTAGFSPSLKWPNDLVVGDRKLAGMLSEADVADGRVGAVVLGIGINCNWDDFPPEIAEGATACNLVSGSPVNRAELLVTFLERLEFRYQMLSSPGGAQAILGEYRIRCSTIGRDVRVDLADGAFHGKAVGVDDDGRLLVNDAAGTTTPVTVGDVVHLRPV